MTLDVYESKYAMKKAVEPLINTIPERVKNIAQLQLISVGSSLFDALNKTLCLSDNCASERECDVGLLACDFVFIYNLCIWK